MTVGTFAQGQMGALQSSAFQPTVPRRALKMLLQGMSNSTCVRSDLHARGLGVSCPASVRPLSSKMPVLLVESTLDYVEVINRDSGSSQETLGCY